MVEERQKQKLKFREKIEEKQEYLKKQNQDHW